MKILYVVHVYKWKRWNKTIWTPGGKPVSRHAAMKAKARAERAFPNARFRIKEVSA